MIVHIVKLHFPAQPSFLTLVWLVPSPIHHAYTIIANPIIANPITNASQFLQCLSLTRCIRPPNLPPILLQLPSVYPAPKQTASRAAHSNDAADVVHPNPKTEP